MALVIVSAKRRMTRLNQARIGRRRRTFLSRSAGQIHPGQQEFEEVSMGLVKETLSRGGAIGSGQEEVVHNSQRVELAMADAM